MKTDEMREEYDFSQAKRGVAYGKVEKKMSPTSSALNLHTTKLAVCIKTFDTKLLIARKIYDVTYLANNLIEVTDETGEKEIYPADYFFPLSLPVETENFLTQIAA